MQRLQVIASEAKQSSKTHDYGLPLPPDNSGVLAMTGIIFGRNLISGLLALVLVCNGYNTAFAQSYEDKYEYQKKVDLIYNFIRFSEWPSDTFSSPNQKFVVGILGSPFGRVIDQLFGKKVKGRKIEIKRFARATFAQEDFLQAQVLFISKSEQAAATTSSGLQNLKSIFGRAAAGSVMTIGETQSFAEKGGMVSLIENEGEIRFKINREVAKAANIKIGLELVKLGEIVDTGALPELTTGPIRVAILPARNNAAYRRGLERVNPYLFRQLGTSQGIIVTHAADPRLAKALSADVLKMEITEQGSIWMPADRFEQTEPDIKKVKSLIKGLDVRAVLMYSLPDGGYPFDLRLFLVDVKTNQVHRTDTTFNENPTNLHGTAGVANQLIRKYLADLVSRQIQLAVIPACL